jgi:hypothetical protein
MRFFLAFSLLLGTGFSADLVAQYHVWFTGAQTCPTSFPTSTWNHWAWWSEQDNPCNFVGGTSWLRDTSTTAYPLIGPYKSTSEDVFRWHIRLAKEAGISAFLTTTNPGAGAENDAHIANFLILLKIANQENFKVGIETWMPAQGTADFYARVKSNLDQALASPDATAYYRINNLPVVWFRFWGRWDSLENLKSNLLNARQAFWIEEGNLTFSELAQIAPSNGSQITQIAKYNYPTPTGCALVGGYANYVSDYLGQLRANGYKPISHVYPRFNESAIINEPGRNPPRICLGNNGQVLESFWTQTSAGAADVAIIESWQDFNEMTMIEPGVDIYNWKNYGQESVYFGDAYKPLKQVAGLNGLTFNPPFPPCSIVDPAMLNSGFVTCTGNSSAIKPTISIGAQPTLIPPGETSLLSWWSTDATTVTINQGIGTVATTGMRTVTPAVTTTYTATATGPGGTASGSVTVNVKKKGPQWRRFGD